ncbi:MAG: zincin-like metallopeptidase domain-containing protein [Ignavibacteria bacterium]|nr:zincin-like metallopeptidase domain-containing protein [Ignavibacteria bacterium]
MRVIIIQKTTHNDYYNKLVTELIELMKSGKIIWQEPWFSQVPRNYATKRKYNGINIVNLNYNAYKRGFSSNYWLTEKQAKSINGSIKAEELKKPAKVIMARWYPKNWIDEKSVKHTIYWLMIRLYPVYNLEQTNGLQGTKKYQLSFDYIDQDSRFSKADLIIKTYKECPEIKTDNYGAYYNPKDDVIAIPHKKNFYKEEEYYSTLFHELVHSTGHPTRLKRQSFLEKVRFGDEKYAKEEIIAELGSVLLCSLCGFFSKTKKNSAAYLQSWLNGLERDYTLLYRSFSNAQNAVNYIIGEKVLNENKQLSLFDEVNDKVIWKKSTITKWI